MLDGLEDCYCCLGDIMQNVDRMQTIQELRNIAEANNGGIVSGHAAWLLHNIYEDGDYVAKNPMLAQQYFNMACAKGDTFAIIKKLWIEEKPFDEVDEYEKKLIESGCYWEFEVWSDRADLCKFKYRKRWVSYNPIKAIFARIKFTFKAMTTVPKQRFFDTFRKDNRKKFFKTFLGLLVPTVLVLFFVYFVFMR